MKAATVRKTQVFVKHMGHQERDVCMLHLVLGVKPGPDGLL